MSFEYTYSNFIVIPTGIKKEKLEMGKWGGNVSPFFWPLLIFPPVSFLTVIILSIKSVEVLLFLVLLIQINIHNRMEINL